MTNEVGSDVDDKKETVRLKKKKYRELNRAKISENYRRYVRENLHPDYGVWKNMKARCHWSKHRSYKNYGGRGIAVCDRWRESFDNFIADMGPRPEPRHLYSIDRYPDRNGNYEPGNCRWTTMKSQCNNTRKNLEYKLATDENTEVLYLDTLMTLKELSDITLIHIDVVKYRYCDALIKGENFSNDPERLARYIVDPFGSARMYMFLGKPYTMKELELISGFSRSLIKDRIKLGWQIERIMETPPIL